MSQSKNAVQSYARLALISFVILYLELVVIRWLSTEIRIFAYFKNFPLLAAFLGFGIGCIVAPRTRNLFRFTPWFLLVVAAVICFAPILGYVHVIFIDPLEFYTIGVWNLNNPVSTLLKGFSVLVGVFGFWLSRCSLPWGKNSANA